MPQPRHAAIAAGLALTLTLGAAATPVYAADATVHASDANADGTSDGGTLPAPSDYDKDDFYTGDAASVALMARSASSLSPVSLSDEMKYFCKYESSQNYDQGFSYGDGYNAMGYYQFDRRHALFGFLKAVYAYNPTTYAMFAGPISNEATLSSKSYATYDEATDKLTPMAQELNDAWHAAYQANPTEFSALQDAYSYNTYYLPVRNLLKTKYGIDLDKRADCVKGLMWGLSNLFGYGGCQNYLNDAKISEDMTDEELVTAVCDTVVTRVTYYCSSQLQYWQGWQNRYRSEKATCLAYLAQHEADQGASGDNAVDGDAAGDAAGNTADGSSGSDSSGQSDANQDAGADEQGSAGEQDNADQGGSDGQDGSNQNSSGAADEQDAGTSDSQGSTDAGGSGTSDDTAADTGSDQQSGNQDQSSSNDGTAGGSGATTDTEQDDNAAGGSGPAATTPDAESDGQASSNGSSSDGAADSDASGQNGTNETTDGSSTSSSDEKDATSGAQGSSSNASSTSADKGSEQATSTADATAGDASSKDSGAAAQTAAPTGGLPQTGDIAGLVMMGASGLGVAGASFVSLGKEKRARREKK